MAETFLHIFDARPDTLDFRDRMYVPSLHEVPTRINLEDYKGWAVPILNQGREGACTGFGLATVANYLFRRRKVVPDPTPVSPRMLYEMAKRYDEYPGQNYTGSSARGAMKGWNKHGVCSEDSWPYQAAGAPGGLTDERTSDALRRPLGAYFRVNHKDLVAMHSAMAEVGVLYATATVHEGWMKPGKDGLIPYPKKTLGGHAFAIVAYDEHGFWIQNSWGPGWGQGGFGLVTYDDWLANGSDVWAAQLGAPVTLTKAASTATAHSAAAGRSRGYSYSDLRPHIVSLGNEGKLNEGGDFGTSRQEVENIFRVDFPRVTRDWKKKRLFLYAHGGLVSEDTAVQRLADYRPRLLASQVYPVSFIWHSDLWATITNILQDAIRQRRPEGILDSSKDFMLNRLDDALEPLARSLMGKVLWDEMKENAVRASELEDGGARIAMDEIARLAKSEEIEINIVSHSAGSIFEAPIVRLLTSPARAISSGYMKGQRGYGLTVETCTLWAPACTIQLFKDAYVPAIRESRIKRFALFTLTDAAEQDDSCANIYHKSLLYMVANALEQNLRIPSSPDHPGTPMLGMEKFIRQDREVSDLFKRSNADWILAPNTAPDSSQKSSTAHHHGDFDDDQPTVDSTFARITSAAGQQGGMSFSRSASSLREQRQGLVAKVV
jgi:hypothetical protein